MSSFRQLMMRKKGGGSSKTEIFATKYGSPTIVDGVASGFSSSNYFQLPLNITGFTLNNGFTCKIRFTTGSNPQQTQCIFEQHYYSGVGVQLGILQFGSSGLNYFVFYYCNLSSYNSAFSGLNFSLSPYTTYDFECEYVVGDGISWKLGEVGNLITQTKLTSANYTNFDYTRPINIGYSPSGDGIFTGSIDLKKCLLETDDFIWKGGYL